MRDVKQGRQSPFIDVPLQSVEFKPNLVLVVPVIGFLQKLVHVLFGLLGLLTVAPLFQYLLNEIHESLLVYNATSLDEMVRNDVLLDLKGLLDVVEVILVSDEYLSHVVLHRNLVHFD